MEADQKPQKNILISSLSHSSESIPTTDQQLIKCTGNLLDITQHQRKAHF